MNTTSITSSPSVLAANVVRAAPAADVSSASPCVSPSRRSVIAGRVLSGIPVAFLAVDGLMKLVQPAPVLQGTLELGFPVSRIFGLGIALLIGLALYLVPRTAFLGAILLTGYLGGAVAAHVRIDHPLFSHTLFPVYVAVMLWGGLWLRDLRLRALLPIGGIRR